MIDDQDVVRAGLNAWCRDSDPPVVVIASGPDISTALTGPARHAKVVILDLHLRRPDPSLQGLRSLVEAGHNVVVYTHEVDPTIARRCIRVGAKAYVTKGEVEDHLMTAVHDAAAGRPYTTPTLGAALLSDRQLHKAALSDQELRALKAWCGAKSMRLVAESMGLAQSTVKTLISRARDKYEAIGRPAPTKTELIKRALEDGLIDLSDIGGGDWA
ncbi:hypothetical protein Aple_100440 [Acrocarpospora pleiomorpha]|uniref:Response regulatory domain-containing protein n=1 Tax=Acrocarpospora pleiomorpha TaxID=90975 RepID=A0A5M3Y1E2_9ACTN|nr:hypothetical protein Aple_100440 [Acrocarpospora pleiomorpha]